MEQINLNSNGNLYLNSTGSDRKELNNDFKKLLQNKNEKETSYKNEVKEFSDNGDVKKYKTEDVLYLAQKLAMISDGLSKQEKLNFLINIKMKEAVSNSNFGFFQSSCALGQFDNIEPKNLNLFTSDFIIEKYQGRSINTWSLVNLEVNIADKESIELSKIKNVTSVFSSISNISKYSSVDNVSKLPRERNEVFQLPVYDTNEYKRIFFKMIDSECGVRLLYRDFSRDLNVNKIEQYIREHLLFNNKPIQLIYNGFKRTINAS